MQQDEVIYMFTLLHKCFQFLYLRVDKNNYWTANYLSSSKNIHWKTSTWDSKRASFVLLFENLNKMESWKDYCVPSDWCVWMWDFFFNFWFKTWHAVNISYVKGNSARSGMSWNFRKTFIRNPWLRGTLEKGAKEEVISYKHTRKRRRNSPTSIFSILVEIFRSPTKSQPPSHTAEQWACK